MASSIKYIIKSIVIGIVSVIVINFIGQFINFRIPFTILSILILGFLRLPGFIILLFFQIL